MFILNKTSPFVKYNDKLTSLKLDKELCFVLSKLSKGNLSFTYRKFIYIKLNLYNYTT